MTTVIATSYAMDILRASSSVAGFASGIFVIGVMCARLAIGKRLDKINLKKWLLIGLVACFLFNILYFYSHNIFMLDLTRFLHGASYGLCSSVCGTIVARMIPSFKRGVGIGYYSLSGVLASGIASFVAIYLVNHNAFDTSFVISLCLIFAAILCVFAMRVRELKKGLLHIGEPPNKNTLKTKLLAFIEPSAIKISLIGFMAAFCSGSILSFIGAYCKERNLIEAGAMFFLVYFITSLVVRPMAGKIFDSKGHNAIILPSLMFFIIALLLIAFAYNGFVLIISAVFFGIGYGNFISAAQSYAIKVAPKDKMGLASATYYMLIDFGAGVGPYFLGFAIGAFGYGVAFEICAGVIVLALMTYYKLIARA